MSPKNVSHIDKSLSYFSIMDSQPPSDFSSLTVINSCLPHRTIVFFNFFFNFGSAAAETMFLHTCPKPIMYSSPHYIVEYFLNNILFFFSVGEYLFIWRYRVLIYFFDLTEHIHCFSFITWCCKNVLNHLQNRKKITETLIILRAGLLSSKRPRFSSMRVEYFHGSILLLNIKCTLLY